MRTMIARTILNQMYSNPSDAILASMQADSRLRALRDEQVAGRTIKRVIWDDAALALQLDSGQYLNCVAQKRQLICSLDRSSAVTQPAPDDVVLLELDGRTIEWDRGALARRYIDQTLERLWFGDGVVFVYVRRAVLACHLVESCAEGRPWLFWTESD